MTSFFLAMQFLTIIPIKIKNIDDKKMSWSMAYFPVIGLFLGLLLIGINDLLLILHFEQISSGIILIVSLIILTGGIHLDGLADTADALLSRKNKDEMLVIMRDPHIGVMGVIAVISIILLKIAFLSATNLSLRPVSLILMCVLSRWSMVLLMFLFPYARKEGKAKVYVNGLNYKIFITTAIITLAISAIVWRAKGLIAIASVSVIACVTGLYVKRKIDGITGDVLGAVNEIVEAVTLAGICVL